MDKKLLDALNNLSFALEEISDALNNAKSNKPKSATTTALQGGDMNNQIKLLDKGIKDLKKDNKEILKNQKTLIDLARGKDDKTEKVGAIGDPKQKEKIKDGVSSIILIAVGVLAIGAAFKLIGNVNFASVIALAIALPLLAHAFQEIAKMKELKPNEIGNMVFVVLAISVAITLSSYILSMVAPVGAYQAFTAILIAAAFSVMAYNLHKITDAMAKINLGGLRNLIFMPLVFIALSAAIVGSSYLLGMVKPIGFAQAITAILIAGMFTVISYGLGKLLNAFSGLGAGAIVASFLLPIVLVSISRAIVNSSFILSKVQPITLGQAVTSILIAGMFSVISYGLGKLLNAFSGLGAGAIVASFLLPIILVSISRAIVDSSHLLSGVKLITFGQFLTSVGIAIVFIPISFALPYISKALKDINVVKAILMPIILVAMAYAIQQASLILSEVKSINIGLLFNIIAQSITLAIIGIALGYAFKLIGGIPITTVIKGGLILLAIAATLMLSSLIIAKGTYDVYPDLNWVLNTALALGTFGAAVIALGLIATTGVGLVAYLAGIPMVLGIAATIVKVSEILSKGTFNNPGMFEWAASTALLYATFTPILILLGGVAVANAVVSAFGPNPWKLAGGMMIDIANTIVGVSNVFKEASFTGGPSKDWAEGVGIAIGAFAPVYRMLVANSIMKIFGGGGIGPDDFNKAIETVSGGIIFAAKLFANTTAFKNGPPKAWAEGVGGAIGAFAPVYAVLAKSKGTWKKGPSIDDMKNAIKTISESIVEAANFFGKNEAAFDITKAPKKAWAEGVGGAISAFIPALDFISKNSGIFRGDGSKLLLKGLTGTAMGIVNASHLLSGGNYNTIVPETWTTSLSKSIKTYVDLIANYIYPKREWLGDALSKFSWVTKSMKKTGKIFGQIGKSVANVPENWMVNVDSNIRMYIELAKYLTTAKTQYSSVTNAVSNMKEIALSYTQLAKGVSKLNSELEKIDLDKLNALKNLTGSIVLLSLMDSEQFNSMMDALEEKASVFVDVINELDKKTEKAGGGTKAAPSPNIKSGGGAGVPQKSMSDLYAIMESVDAKLAQIAKSNDNLSKYVDEIRTSDLDIKKGRKY